MAFSTYADLQLSIGDWLNRADLEQQIPDFIALAETTLNQVLRDGRMAAMDTLTLAAGLAPLSIDTLEIIYVQSASTATAPLEQVSPQQLAMLRRARLRSAGTPKFFAVVGRNVLVAPIPASGTLQVTAYKKIPALTAVAPTNWLLQEAPHMYLYASLMHASPFLKDDARSQFLQTMLTQQIADAVNRNTTLSLEDVRTAGFSLSAPGDNIPPRTGI